MRISCGWCHSVACVFMFDRDPYNARPEQRSRFDRMPSEGTGSILAAGPCLRWEPTRSTPAPFTRDGSQQGDRSLQITRKQNHPGGPRVRQDGRVNSHRSDLHIHAPESRPKCSSRAPIPGQILTRLQIEIPFEIAPYDDAARFAVTYLTRTCSILPLNLKGAFLW